jgi:hypothetical protein
MTMPRLTRLLERCLVKGMRDVSEHPSERGEWN